MWPADVWSTVIPTAHQLWRIAGFLVAIVVASAGLGAVWCGIDWFFEQAGLLGDLEDAPPVARDRLDAIVRVPVRLPPSFAQPARKGFDRRTPLQAQMADPRR